MHIMLYLYNKCKLNINYMSKKNSDDKNTAFIFKTEI